MKNTNRDNSLLPLCRQDNKKGKRLLSEDGYSSSSACASSSSSKEARAGPMLKAANLVGVSEP
jgi:hypothetical protein